jgi:NAD(P)-dependent dehydrogenase (short-subunit alcohol dehydrogenase family)
MGVLHVCQAFLPHLRAAGGGATIVNISSVLGGFVVPYRSVCTRNRSAGIALHRSHDTNFVPLLTACYRLGIEGGDGSSVGRASR